MAAVCADAHGRHSDAEQGARAARIPVAEVKGEGYTSVLTAETGKNRDMAYTVNASAEGKEAFPPDTSGGKSLLNYIERVLILYMKHPAAWAR